MHTMLSGLDFAVAFLHDILMKSKSIIEHKEHVHKVFTKNHDCGFKLKETKCDFFMDKIKYQSNIIDTIYQPLRLGRIWHKVNF